MPPPSFLPPECRTVKPVPDFVPVRMFLGRRIGQIHLRCLDGLVAEGLLEFVGAAWFDEQRLHGEPAEPGSDDFGRVRKAIHVL